MKKSPCSRDTFISIASMIFHLDLACLNFIVRSIRTIHQLCCLFLGAKSVGWFKIWFNISKNLAGFHKWDIPIAGCFFFQEKKNAINGWSRGTRISGNLHINPFKNYKSNNIDPVIINHTFLDGIFHSKPTSYWGTPMAMETTII